jgi:hypothetical protein
VTWSAPGVASIDASLLRLSLLAIASDRKLMDPLEVTFGEPRWR